MSKQMLQNRFTEAQIIGMIKEQEVGMPTTEVCRRHGLSDKLGEWAANTTLV
jgi:hypothetical protein